MSNLELLELCKMALLGTEPSKTRAKALYRLAVQMARFAWEECLAVGLNPQDEYTSAVDEVQQKG